MWMMSLIIIDVIIMPKDTTAMFFEITKNSSQIIMLTQSADFVTTSYIVHVHHWSILTAWERSGPKEIHYVTITLYVHALRIICNGIPQTNIVRVQSDSSIFPLLRFSQECRQARRQSKLNMHWHTHIIAHLQCDCLSLVSNTRVPSQTHPIIDS